MNPSNPIPAAGPALKTGTSGFAASVGARERRQLVWITLGAIGVFAFLRFLPTGTNLSHMDFRVDAKNSIDFCDPLNPQFIPVVAVASPVSMTLVNPSPAVAGQSVRATLRLRTASGKAIAPEDLLLVHTKLLHLLIADPTLTDYQHVHPSAARSPGEWEFSFTPRYGGVYRIFADFTPSATGRSLYANTEIAVAGAVREAVEAATAQRPAWAIERGGFRFVLSPSVQPVRARQPTDLRFSVVKQGGGAVPMEPIMGAFAHLVAFDAARSGFAHLHPMEVDVTVPPDSVKPVLNFKITIPRVGHYVIWAQVNLGGRETFIPFWFDVVE